MKQLLKKIAIYTLGYHRTNKVIRKLKGDISFSENEAIYEYFKSAGHKTGLMVDVGSHYGGSLAPFYELGWEVLAFEPDPRNHQHNPFAANGRLKYFHVALSDYEESGVSFFASEESSGISGLSKFRDSHVETHKVDITTLKKVLQSTSVDSIQYLKIDTEGHDLMVLKGMDWTDKKIFPEIIQCEYEDSKTVPHGYTVIEMGKYLEDKGYHVLVSEWHPIESYGTPHNWKAIHQLNADEDFSQSWGNLIAYRNPEFKRFMDTYTSQF